MDHRFDRGAGRLHAAALAEFAGLRKKLGRVHPPWGRAQAVVVAGAAVAAVAAGVRRLQHPRGGARLQSARMRFTDLNGRPLRLFSGAVRAERPQSALAQRVGAVCLMWWLAFVDACAASGASGGLAAMLPVRGADWRGPAIHSGRKTTRCDGCAACPETFAALRCALACAASAQSSLRTLRSNWRYTASLLAQHGQVDVHDQVAHRLAARPGCGCAMMGLRTGAHRAGRPGWVVLADGRCATSLQWALQGHHTASCRQGQCYGMGCSWPPGSSFAPSASGPGNDPAGARPLVVRRGQRAGSRRWPSCIHGFWRAGLWSRARAARMTSQRVGVECAAGPNVNPVGAFAIPSRRYPAWLLRACGFVWRSLRRLRAVDDLGGDLFAAVRGQAVHEQGVGWAAPSSRRPRTSRQRPSCGPRSRPRSPCWSRRRW